MSIENAEQQSRQKRGTKRGQLKGSSRHNGFTIYGNRLLRAMIAAGSKGLSRNDAILHVYENPDLEPACADSSIASVRRVVNKVLRRHGLQIIVTREDGVTVTGRHIRWRFAHYSRR